MRPKGNHIHAAVLRAIAELAGIGATPTKDRQKTILIVEEIVSHDWASATFIGATHRIDLRLEGETAVVAASIAALVDTLPEHDIPLSGHIVAEISATPGAHTRIEGNMVTQSLTVNVLTIND